MGHLDIAALEQTPTANDLFNYMIVPNFIKSSQQSSAIENFPKIEQSRRLSMLRSENLNDFVDDVASDVGTLLIFRRSDINYHGHEPFEGKRCSIQLNWLTTDNRKQFQTLRHQLSVELKKFTGRK